MSRHQIQLIDEQKQFAENDAATFVQKHLGDRGLDYRVVSVFGSQSTGKSTLLNRVFGTEFAVMDEAQRQQTTRGIWAGIAEENAVVVLDVEGADGRERGEDQDFERKAALFSLATSDAVIVNMWENMVGLYQGANMGLLKTVLEVHSELFQRAGGPRTLLLFVVRDYSGRTPAANLEGILAADVQKIWAGVRHASGERALSDAFELAFVFLPHKLFAPAEFDTACAALRTRLTVPSAPGYLLGSGLSKGVPADGFVPFARGVWETVVANRDLDLPTQQQLLAQFRCDELARAAAAEFSAQLAAAPWQKQLERGDVVRTLGADMRGLRDAAMAAFDAPAARYHPDVYARKRGELWAQVTAALAPCFSEQLRNLARVARDEWVRKVDAHLDQAPFDVAPAVRDATAAILANFGVIARAAQLGVESESETVDALADFTAELRTLAADRRTRALDRLLAQCERRAGAQGLDEAVVRALALVPADVSDGASLWAGLWTQLESAQRLANVSLCDALSGGLALSDGSADDTETPRLVRVLESRIFFALRARILAELADPHTTAGRLRRRFEDQFKLDEHGVPRVWRLTPDMDALYRRAKTDAEALLGALARIDFSDERVAEFARVARTDDAPDSAAAQAAAGVDEADSAGLLVAIPPARLVALQSQLTRDMALVYTDARQALAPPAQTRIPAWLVLLLLVLGWNELTAVLSSPLYFATLAAALALAFLVYRAGLAGPTFHVARAAVREVSVQMHAQLEQRGILPAVRAHAASFLTPPSGSTGSTTEAASTTKESKEETAKESDGPRLRRVAPTALKES